MLTKGPEDFDVGDAIVFESYRNEKWIALVIERPQKTNLGYVLSVFEKNAHKKVYFEFKEDFKNLEIQKAKK